MKIRSIVLSVVAALALAAAGAGAWAISANSRRASAIAARVNGEAILWSEVDAEVNRFVAQVGADPKSKDFEKQKTELTRGIMDQLILQKLTLQEARKRNLLATDKEVNEQLARIRQQFPSEKTFGDALAKENLNLTTLRELIRFRLTQRRVAEAVTANVKVADEDVRAAFDKDRASYDKPAQIKVSHILFRVTDRNQEPVAQAKARIALAKLADGDKFEDVARKYSEDPGSAERGGDLGYVSRGTLVKEFEEVAWTLKPGQVSGVVKTQFGLHIIKLYDIKPAEAADFNKVKDDVRDKLLAARREKAFEAWLEEQRKAAKIEKFERK
jgi:parvulin-like peptidyl-prolyl isomerase